jgi:hypothetical protein
VQLTKHNRSYKKFSPKEVKLKTFNLLKRIAAACLFIAFFLPLSQCSTQKEKAQVTSVQQPVKAAPSDGVNYAYSSDKDDGIFQTINAFVFIWPTIFILVLLAYPKLETYLSVQVADIALCLVSAFFLLRLTAFGELLIGGYLAWFSLGTYFLITATSFLQRVRKVWYLKTATSSIEA